MRWTALLAFVFIGGTPVWSRAATSDSATGNYRCGIGLVVLGGQLACRVTPKTRLELRFLTGSSQSSDGNVSSQVFGLRGVRIFRLESAWRPYLGMEGAYVSSRSTSGTYRNSGPAFGGFGGVERKISSRVWVGVDAGPYVISLQDKTAHVSDTSLEFVANSFVMVYLF